MSRNQAGGRRLLSGGLVAALLTGCSADAEQPPAPTATPTVTAPAEPRPDRPVVDLAFDVAPDLGSVTGRELVRFTPDLPVCELVFRAWPNKPQTAAAGSGLVVSAVRVDSEPTPFVDEAAGAPVGAPAGTLLRVPLPACVPAGTPVTAELEFSLRLGVDVDERIGRSSAGDTAWFASAFPLLAWEYGVGWDEDPAVTISGESAASEEFSLSLAVTAPARFQVQGTGTRRDSSEDPANPGRTTTEFSAPSVRDVAVYVGDHRTVEFDAGGVTVHFAAPDRRLAASPEEWRAVIESSLADLVDLLGPFPYDDLWVTVVESDSSGIEFPGSLQVADVDPQRRRALVTHEIAHSWFYSLVGNDQGRDPWLDEAFATFAQRVADGDDAGSLADLPEATRGEVGRPIAFFLRYPDPSRAYYDRVYTAGGTALVQARNEVGAEEFDAALRGYLRDNAHTIATPDDVVAAFSDVPEVLQVLVDVEALPADVLSTDSAR